MITAALPLWCVPFPRMCRWTMWGYVLELANHLLNGGRDALREKTEWVLHSIACRAAIKAGDRTTTDEMLALAQKIMDGSVPPFCPHGRPCVLKLTRKELEKQFGRLV